MNNTIQVATLPAWAQAAARTLPLPVIALVLRRLVRTVIAKSPDILDRLGNHASVTFLIDPTDLPIQFLVRPNSEMLVQCRRSASRGDYDARIAGPLAALIAMVSGELDGDALFFSRDVLIEGRTDAILSLRNAIDAAEIDFALEFALLWGPLKPLAEDAAHFVFRVLKHLSDVDMAQRRIQAE